MQLTAQVQASAGVPPTATTAVEDMEQAIAGLELLNGDTEKSFLSIGGKLSSFIEAANFISNRLTALVDIISGAHGASTSQSLQAALDCFTEMRERQRERQGKLEKMRQDAARLKQTLGGFREIVSNLRSIGVLARVEVARLGGSGSEFGSLADDITLLTEHVQGKVESALQNGTVLVQLIEGALQGIAALDEKQVEDLSDAFSNLTAFRDIQERARDSSDRLRARYDEMSAAFREVIVSVQFHDVTRQQVEHVVEALRSLIAEAAGESNRVPRPGQVRGAILRLQTLQLADAAEKFAASAASIAQNLDRIAAHIGQMAEESQTLSGKSKDEKATYFLQMEHGCNDILGHLQRLVEADSTIGRTMGDLEQSIGLVQTSVEEIRAVEIQIRKVAMNATIVATHIGKSGDTIHALSIAMRDQASESGKNSEPVFSVLGTLRGQSRLFGQGGTVAGIRRLTQDACATGLLTAVAELHTSGERSIARIAEIVKGGADLSELLSAARRDFSVGTVFAGAICRSRETLAEIERKAPSGLSDEDCQWLPQALEEFAKRYTMQSEREVHARLIGSAIPMLPDLPKFIHRESGEFGENVDFF